MEDSEDQPWDPETVSQNTTCKSLMDMSRFLHYSLIPAVIIIVVLSCLERRTRRWYLDKKLHKYSGCGGFVIPFDFVRAFNNRWSFGFAFGATVDKLMFLFTKEYDETIPFKIIPGWAKVFWLLLVAIEVGLSSYPYFACLSTSYKMTGAVLGFLYTAIWLTVSSVDIAGCPMGKYAGEYEDIIMYWPSLLCQVALLIRFLYGFVKALRAQCTLDLLQEEAPFLEEHQAQYVQQLLKKPLLQQTQKSWIRRKLYEWDPYFRFPSRMIIMAVIALNSLYAFIMFEYIISNLILQLGRKGVSYLSELFQYQNVSLEEKIALDTLQEFVDVTQGVWIATIVISSLTCLIYMFSVLAFYRKHMKLLQTGKRNLLLQEDAMVSSSQSVVALGRYISWQIAYIIWGYLIIHLVQFVAGMVLMYLVILPMKHGKWMELLDKWGTVILSLVIIMAIKQLQVFMAGWLFLQPKILPNDKHKPLALDNWKAYQIFTYFLFFFTVVVGLTSCLMRLLRSLVLGAWLIGRLDKSVMPKGYESCDSGFKTWVGMLLTDHYHTNPILVCFCHILITKTSGRKLPSNMGAIRHMSSTKPTRTVPRVSERARTRWLLLYTLLNNPDLRKQRKPTSSSKTEDSPNNVAIFFT
ncbi:stimulated by retinoic acid gene 6 protein-like [Tiliqua scincoides]|uniref:stimulated by retinoic acid gene 6 protein-like n=1 Tax=Tiliqua scincoides TaxID=71010 RepID=UPI0034623C40